MKPTAKQVGILLLLVMVTMPPLSAQVAASPMGDDTGRSNPPLKIGDDAVTQNCMVNGLPYLRVRSGPSTSARILGRIGDGVVLHLIAGPEFADGIWWYRHTNPVVSGWSAYRQEQIYMRSPTDGSPSVVTSGPIPPSVPPSDLETDIDVVATREAWSVLRSIPANGVNLNLAPLPRDARMPPYWTSAYACLAPTLVSSNDGSTMPFPPKTRAVFLFEKVFPNSADAPISSSESAATLEMTRAVEQDLLLSRGIYPNPDALSFLEELNRTESGGLPSAEQPWLVPRADLKPDPGPDYLVVLVTDVSIKREIFSNLSDIFVMGPQLRAAIRGEKREEFLSSVDTVVACSRIVEPALLDGLEHDWLAQTEDGFSAMRDIVASVTVPEVLSEERKDWRLGGFVLCSAAKSVPAAPRSQDDDLTDITKSIARYLAGLASLLRPEKGEPSRRAVSGRVPVRITVKHANGDAVEGCPVHAVLAELFNKRDNRFVRKIIHHAVSGATGIADLPLYRADLPGVIFWASKDRDPEGVGDPLYKSPPMEVIPERKDSHGHMPVPMKLP